MERNNVSVTDILSEVRTYGLFGIPKGLQNQDVITATENKIFRPRGHLGTPSSVRLFVCLSAPKI